MRRGAHILRLRPALSGAIISAVALCGGCSLLLHVDAEQCSSTSECASRGPAFANLVCQAGTCAPPPDAGADAHPDARTDAAVDSGASKDAGGNGDSAPSPEAGCITSADCVATSATHPDVACDVSSGACLQLTTDECPTTVGDYSGKLAPPIFVGAFATLPPGAPLSHPSFLNYKLAIQEFTSAGGIPAGPGVGLRMPVAVICNSAANIDTAMAHLQADLHVPAIVGAFDSITLRTMFVKDAYPNKTLVINPFGANSTLTSLKPTDGLLWHMLGQPSDDAPAYQAFFPRVEAYVRSAAGQNLSADAGADAGAPALRVATVTANATDTQDLAAAALGVMKFNGKSIAQNTADGNYLNVAIDSILSGNDLASIDTSGAVGSLLSFKPNVIVSFASAELGQVLQVLEIDLQKAMYASNPKPFYLLGPYNMDSQTLINWVGSGNAGSPSDVRRTRVAGVGVASATDPHVLDAYNNRFTGAFMNAGALGQENYYDAMYFVVYSVVGAGHVPNLGGQNAAQGLLRLLSGASYDMGPSAMGSVFGALGDPNGTISLFGALGPPTFTISTGARIGAGSAYCIKRNPDLTPAYAYDVLRVSSGDGGAPGLSGSFTCYPGM